MRALVILWHLTPLTVSFLRDRRRWVWWGKGAVRTEAFHRRRAERMVVTLARLGPSFVKMAQVFSSRADLIPEPYVGALSTLTDQVPPVPIAAIRQEIQRSYGRPAEQVFERFEPEPLAAASLGQVHRARHGGRDVVIKVLRPGVERLIREDLAVFRPLVAWFSRRFPNPHVANARIVIEEFAVRVWEELDFEHEAANAIEIGANFRGNPRVIVPEVVTELTRKRTLVLEYVEGIRVDRIQAHPGDSTHDPRGVVSRVMELYLQMMLVDGFFHADPHPGNVLVAPDGRIVLLDFGMVIRVPREMRASLVRTVFAAIRRDLDGILDGFRNLGLLEAGVTNDQLRPLAERLMDIAYDPATMAERVDLLAQEIMASLYDWPVRLSSEMVYFARTATLIEGLGVRYDPAFNAIHFATPIAIRMRGAIQRSLDLGDGTSPIDYPTIVGAVLGRAARAVADWWGRVSAPAPTVDPPHEGNGHRLLLPSSTNGKGLPVLDDGP
ncbi:MAG: AarF/ABC1/UbiB kinase family protein [Cytophagaceae bacterium]|nr:AarF/ABC1/UbiB kinase family protein [Gemmatimonadaceae bacterium]